MKKYWFKRKTYGWEWSPATWEGWLVISVYLASVAFLIFLVDKNADSFNFAWSFFLPLGVLTFLLIIVSWKKGELPRWPLGEGTKKRSRGE